MKYEDVEEGMFLYSMDHGGSILYVTEKLPEYDKIKVKYLDKRLVASEQPRYKSDLEYIVDVRDNPGTMKQTVKKVFEVFG